MQTIKTGVVVALLLAVCYGAFVALNAPEPNLPDELLSEFDWNPDEAGLEGLMNIEMPIGDSIAGFDATSSPPSAAGIQTAGIQNTGGSTPFDTSGLALPTLPSFGTSTNSPSVVGLPGLPATGSGSVTAADGPAVALGGAPTTTTTQPPLAFDFQPPPQGQLVSQTRPTPSVGQAGIKLPLLTNPPTAPAGESAAKEQPTLPFATAREQALELASNGKLRDALQILSGYYASPELNSTQHGDLVDLLDALSREVIYSPRHLAEPPYLVTANDTIESLAAKYQISTELLRAVNQLGDSKALVDGSQVKVLPGPFRAEVSLGRQELTIFMGELYAGRFPVSFGKDPSPVEGEFEIVDRRRDRTYYGTGGKVIAAGDSRNPYGGYWLNLGQDLCIHGTPEMSSDDLQGAGCISLAPLDAADVYNILAQSSQVSIVH